MIGWDLERYGLEEARLIVSLEEGMAEVHLEYPPQPWGVVAGAWHICWKIVEGSYEWDRLRRT